MATVKVKVKSKSKNEGKSAFLKEFFVDHPGARKAAINEAWQEAGNDGTISDSLASKVRADLGLTTKRRTSATAKKNAGAGKRSSASPRLKGGKTGFEAAGRGTAELNGRTITTGALPPAGPRATGGARIRVLIQLEGEIDEMIHKVKGADGLPEFEEALRRARRILARSHGD